MTASTTLLLVLLAAAVLVALAGLAWRSLRPASLTFGTADATKRRGADRRVNDPALPYVGEGHERRQRTRRQHND